MSGLFGPSEAGTSRRAVAKTSLLQASYRFTTSIEGSVIPLLWGRNRLTANIFFAWGWQPVAQQSASQAMGKGGGAPRHLRLCLRHVGPLRPLRKALNHHRPPVDR